MEGLSSDIECGPKKKRLKPLVSEHRAKTAEVMIEVTHIKDEILECEKCDFTATTTALLYQHTQTHNVEVKNQCDMCTFTAESSVLLKEHKLTHNEEESFQCDMCDFATETAALLKEHVQTHKEENRTECDMCNFIAETSELLKEHIKTHFQIEVYECDKCDYSVETPHLLKLHMKMQHDEEAHKCDMCDVRTKTAALLKEHIKTHIDETYSCDMCNFRTETAALLKDHIKTHTEMSALDQRSHRPNTHGTVGNTSAKDSKRTPCNSCAKADQQKKSYYNCSVDGCSNSTLNGELSFFKLPAATERSLPQEKSSDGGKRKKRQKDDEEWVRDGPSRKGRKPMEKTEELLEKRRLQNKIRCQRYREKKKSDVTNDSQSCQNPITPDEELIIKRRKELNKEKSKRYRDRKRAINLIKQTEQPSIIVNHIPEDQNFRTSHIPGPSTKDHSIPHKINITKSNPDAVVENDIPSQVNRVPQIDESVMKNVSNSQSILPRNVTNKILTRRSQQNIALQTYSSFPQNSSAHREFQKDFFENEFGHLCNICDRLWFKKDLKVIASANITPNIRTILENANLAEVKICSTCLATTNKNRVPPLAVYNGFKYPPIPEDLKSCPLDLVTEKLVSPKIPFMQIRRLRHIHESGPFGIYGQVINVPTEVDTMVNSLPRNLDDDHSITVHIKRKQIHKSSLLYGMVNKTKIKTWLQYLKDTPLYTFYGIAIDDDFLNSEEDVDDEIIIFDEDGDSHISEHIPIDESLVAQQQTLMWNDEMYLKIAAGEGSVPISLLFDEHAEELSFPQIYLGQFRTFRDGVSVTPFMMATSELRRSDRRGVTPHHLLYMAMKIMRIRIKDSVTIAFKNVGKGNISKEQVESEDYMQNCIESNLAFLRTIPNSAYYWSERRKDLFAMIRQFGNPTVFFTISANEVGWPKLLQLLHNFKHNSKISEEDAAALHFMEKSTLVNEDAVICGLYFNRLVNVLLKILQSKRFSPFKKYRILYYFKRIEFQHEGSPHAHILAWLDNAPEDPLEKDYNKAIDLIDFLVSVSATESSGNIKLQTHKHNFKCYKDVTSKRMKKCKFEAPFMPIKETMILTPMKDTELGFKMHKAKYDDLRQNLDNYEYVDFQTFYEDNKIHSDQEYVDIIRAGIDRPKVFLKRQPNEKWHNHFNPFILNIVKSRTDFQFITDEYSCAAYIVEYVNKTDRGISDLQRQIIEIMDEHPEYDMFEISKNITTNILNQTEMTSQEAAWYLLREPMSKTSTTNVYIPTVRPIERQRIKKTMKELGELDDDCTEIWKESWFDKYEKRPENFEDISLAQFVSKYYKNNKGEYVKRDEPRVIRYRNYDMATDPNEYKREMVTLYIPFRHEGADILDDMKFLRLYDENVDLILEKRKEFESNVDIQRTLEICRELCREDVPGDNEEINDVVGEMSG